ncbi:serine hydrolase domain-containing protein [Bailinhaonella thermotolerans]|uniref:serine hydrolase domain-containing protein n=1 Tax=Bailinhaonella thermotolerans TaxID=1070861 RepID=UPI001F5B7775|nr:serine hydrolase domain-containing protein [Bailinhaonella thermotolerans]
MLDRRNLLKVALAAPAGAAVAWPAHASTPAPAPTPTRPSVPTVVGRGDAPAALAKFDHVMKSFMLRRAITAGQLAIARKGKLVFARGYTGTTPWSSAPPVTPTSVFRIASAGKHITAAAILRLEQEGRLKLSDPITKHLALTPMPGKTADPRLAKVTLWRLMQHLAGWDRAVSGDPLWNDHTIARTLGTSLPIDHDDIMRFMTGRPLDFDPGTKMVYCNYGYMLLGRVIEKVSGLSYEDYVTRTFLRPLKITRMRLGGSLRSEALPGEVAYTSKLTNKSVVDNSGAVVPYPYGGFNMPNQDANGGWVASAVDLVRFERIFDLPTTTNLLSSTAISRAFAKPETGVPSNGAWYGGGWYVRTKNGGLNTWHTGSMPGTFTLVVRRYDGVTFAAFFNRRQEAGDPGFDEIDPLLYDTVSAVKTWPNIDLSAKYFR